MKQDSPVRDHSGGKRNGDDVVPGGPPDVLEHLPVGGATQFDDRRDVARIASHQHHVARCDGLTESNKRSNGSSCQNRALHYCSLALPLFDVAATAIDAPELRGGKTVIITLRSATTVNS